MTNLALPAGVGFKAVNWTLDRNVAVMESPLGRNVQRLIRTGDRWRTTLQVSLIAESAAEQLAAFLDEATRGDNYLLLSPAQNRNAGALSAPELILTNTSFQTDTTGWTAVGATLTANSRRIKILNSGAASGSATQGVTVTAGAPHVFVGDRRRGNVLNWRLQLRNSTPTAEVDLAYTTEGRAVEVWTPTTASSDVRLLTDTAIANDYAYWSNPSLSRCLQVSGASQTGNRLNIKNGPVSTNAALLAGTFVTFAGSGGKYQMVRLTENLDLDSTGAGTLVFEPGIRVSPAADAPVILRNPFARFIMSQSGHDVSAPNFYGFSFDLVEDVTA